MSDFPVIVPYHKRPSWFWRVIFIGAPLALAFGAYGFRVYGKWPEGLRISRTATGQRPGRFRLFSKP